MNYEDKLKEFLTSDQTLGQVIALMISRADVEVECEEYVKETTEALKDVHELGKFNDLMENNPQVLWLILYTVCVHNHWLKEDE